MLKTIALVGTLATVVLGVGGRVTAAEGQEVGERDCNRCPRMVLVQGNRSIDSFEISHREVTYNEYLAFVESTGRVDDKSCSGTSGTRRHPHVACVTWEDAGRYATWLSELTGRAYRLPSERQWVYADQSDSVISGLSSSGAWEWVADCFQPRLENAPSDGSPWIEPGDDCATRVVRPGRPLRRPTEHSRLQWRRDESTTYLGFRVVRLLGPLDH